MDKRPRFTCPVCGSHYWGTGHFNEDGTATAYCQPTAFMRPCKFSWLRPHQDAEVGLEPYDQIEMAERVRKRREA